MDFRILGPLEVWGDGRELQVRQGLPRALLIGLLLRQGETVVADVLIDWLWPERAPANAANALQIQVSYLRKTLGLAAKGEQLPALVTRAGGYALLTAPDTVDADRFVRLAQDSADALAAELPAGALTAAEQALTLWRGHPLADVAYASFAQGEVARLEAVRLAVIETRNEALLALGRHHELLARSEQLTREHPLHEPFHAQRVLALYRAGRQADALEAFEAAREALVEGLGLDPGARLRELEQAVLRQDAALDWTPPPPGPAAENAGPAARSAAPAPSAPRLPAPPHAVIGREEDVEHLRGLLGQTRCLTLTGPGGAGKTTLALDLGRTLEAAAPVCLVELGGVSEPGQVALAIAAAVGAATPPDRPPLESAIEHLGAAECVLLLDNCEHVIAAAAEAAADLLRRCAGVRVLATSREPLSIRGELAWPVPPLRLPDAETAREAAAASPAVRLFVERARAVRADFTLDDRNVDDIVRLCALLDGLPLAIELAAARAGVLPPRALLERLDDRFALLVGGARDLPARQRSLAGAIAWSHDQLEPHEQTTLARLSVFNGPFPLEAALAVAGDGLADPLSALEALVRQSLVSAEGEHFRLLESIRAFAAERLAAAPAEEHAARTRHARWHAEWAVRAAAPLRTPEQDGWLRALRQAGPNLTAALEWSFANEPPAGVRLAGALAWFWGMDARFTEARHWLELAIAVPDAAPPDRAEALFGAGLHAASLGELARAEGLCAQSAELFAASGDDDGLGRALLYRGVAEWGLERLDDAAATHDEAIGVFTRAASDWGVATARFLRARTALDRREEDVDPLLAQAQAEAHATGDRHLEALVLDLRARRALDEGRAAEAERLARDSVALHESVGFAEGVAASLHALALALLAQGRHGEALPAQVRGLRIGVEASHPAGAAEAAEGLAAVLHAGAGEPAEAAWLLATADRLREERGLRAPQSHRERLAPVRAALAGVEPPRRPAAPPLSALHGWLREHASESAVQGA